MEIKSICIGKGCPFLESEGLDDDMVELRCKKKPIPVVGGYKVIYSGPNNDGLIDQAVVNIPCPLPPQKVS